MASRVHDWPKRALVGAFMDRLKADLTTEVRVHRPKTYAEMFEIAQICDDHMDEFKNNGTPTLGQAAPNTWVIHWSLTSSIG